MVLFWGLTKPPCSARKGVHNMSFAASLKETSAALWEAGYNHPFVQQLGQGTLDKAAFRFYLLQDYHYLLAYAKVCALGVVKADNEDMMARFAATQAGILTDELGIHREYMAAYGVTPQQIADTEESLCNRAYTANMLAVGQQYGMAELLASILPCPWTYHDYACRLKAQYAHQMEDNFFQSWIEAYAAPAFGQSFAWYFHALDDLCAQKSPAELARIERIFRSSVEFECLFWDMAYRQQMSFRP